VASLLARDQTPLPENAATEQLSNKIIEFDVAAEFALRIGYHRVADVLRMETQRPSP
jgi:hypothetical protein